jgi:hypothetical protein
MLQRAVVHRRRGERDKSTSTPGVSGNGGKGCSIFVLADELSSHLMSDDLSPLSTATPEDVADALAFALRFQGRKRVHNADELMSAIVAKRLVEHLERSGFVVMKRPPIGGGAAGPWGLIHHPRFQQLPKKPSDARFAGGGLVGLEKHPAELALSRGSGRLINR